jgi:hypothetical protein
MTGSEPELTIGPADNLPLGLAQSTWMRRQGFPPGALMLTQVPLPLPGRDRVAWRIMALLVCLSACRGRSATVEQLHVLSWAIRDQSNFRDLVAVWEQRAGAPRLLRAWDHSLNDTLRLARAAGVITQRSNGRQALSDLGMTLVESMRTDPGQPMTAERGLLVELGSLTESGMWNRLGKRTSTGKTRRNGK